VTWRSRSRRPSHVLPGITLPFGAVLAVSRYRATLKKDQLMVCFPATLDPSAAY
jgi:hypothetical protein